MNHMGEKEELQPKGINNMFWKIIVENISNLEKEMNIQTQEAFRTDRQDQKRTIPHHIMVKTLERTKKIY